MKYSICIYSKITTNNFQKEYVYAHLLNNKDAQDSNDSKQTIFSTDHKFTTKFTNHTKAANLLWKEKQQEHQRWTWANATFWTNELATFKIMEEIR